MMWMGFLVLMIGLATGWFWLVGGFNPIGHLGENPWHSKRDERPGHCRYCGRSDCIGRHQNAQR